MQALILFPRLLATERTGVQSPMQCFGTPALVQHIETGSGRSAAPVMKKLNLIVYVSEKMLTILFII